MLNTLRVKNLALVENIRVDFHSGLNVITGETGAGKSMLMGALNLVLGARADKSLIRTGEEVCGAEALFQMADSSDIDAILETYGLDACEDGQLVIRRIVKASGGQNIVNDSPVTLQVLKQLGDALVDMHGPHDHQSLLKPDTQLNILDAFGHLWEERAEYESAYEKLRAVESRKKELTGHTENLDDQKEMLVYRIKEIDDAALREGEEEEISREHEVLGNAQRIQELATIVLGGLSEAEGSAFDTIAGTRKALEELARLIPQAKDWLTETDQIVQQIQEVNTDIRAMVDTIESSPVRLEWLDNRLAVYQKMKRKYGPELTKVLSTLSTSQEKLEQLETLAGRIAELETEAKQLRKQVMEHGRVLRKKRKASAHKLSTAIEKELKALGLLHGEFGVTFEEMDPRPSGVDEVDFQFAPNVGEPRRPLRIIASSGEISRVMLATKTVLADHDRIPVLVFDEIDTNIGGETGAAVGKKLKEISLRHQVICITHLPQVAVFGDIHFAVAKHVKEGRTFTQVTRLEEDGRVEEVARMLGGRDMTTVTIDHAREMLSEGFAG